MAYVVTVSFRDGYGDRLRREAGEQGRSVPGLIRWCVEEELGAGVERVEGKMEEEDG